MKIESDGKAWEQVSGPTEPGVDGTFTDRMKVPGGWLYRVEEWGPGEMSGKLLYRNVCFVPNPRGGRADDR